MAHCFLKHLEATYRTVDTTPYHNNMHAADVAQAVHSLLSDLGLGVYCQSLSKLALIIGALVHDVGHDGRSNNFHINLVDNLALTYNDQSVQENYHASLAFKILNSNHNANVLSGLSQGQLARVRKDIIASVLSTDMAKHFDKVSSMKEFVDRLGDDRFAWLTDTAAETELQTMILHTADISNTAKPIELSDRWAMLLKEEFLQQGDEEKHCELPVSPLCDRDTVRFASSQAGFLEFIVKPSLALLAQLSPQVQDVIMPIIDQNTQIWAWRRNTELSVTGGQ